MLPAGWGWSLACLVKLAELAENGIFPEEPGTEFCRLSSRLKNFFNADATVLTRVIVSAKLWLLVDELTDVGRLRRAEK